MGLFLSNASSVCDLLKAQEHFLLTEFFYDSTVLFALVYFDWEIDFSTTQKNVL